MRSRPSRADCCAVRRASCSQRVPPEQLLGEIRDLDSRSSTPGASRSPCGSARAPDGSTVLEANTADSPFLVDTVRGAIAAQGLSVRTLLHPVFGIERAGDGSIERDRQRTRRTDARVGHAHRAGRAAGARARDGRCATRLPRSLGELRLAVADHADMAAWSGA